MIERIHMEILAAIKRHGTVTKAADVLHLSQSALSHSMKKLESQINTPVWEKAGRNLRITPAGEQIIALAERVLPQISHTEAILSQIAKGELGMLRIGMECHPCYQWLLKVIDPYLKNWPEIDIDVKQRFQFGALGALHRFDIDIIITPDPLFTPSVEYIPVFDYEHRLVVASSHPLAHTDHVLAEDLRNETLLSYPVEPERLDIFSQFLHPAHCTVKKHKRIETTEIMLQMVAAGRGVCALPGWLVDEYTSTMPLSSLRFGKAGIYKNIYVGMRIGEQHIPYLQDFIAQAKRTQ